MKIPKFNTAPPHLKEAMALIKSGRLKEATVAIQNNLNSNGPSNSVNTHTDDNSTAMRDVTPNESTPRITASNPSVPKDLASNTHSTQNENATPETNDTTKAKDTLSEKLQSLTDKMKDFKIDLPSALNLPGMGAGATTHSEPPIAENAKFIKGVFTSSQGNHNYRLYIPSNYDEALTQGSKLPLVVMLHGCTQSPEDFATGTRMNELAETHQSLVLYPSQPASANLNRCWNWFNKSDQQRDQGEPAWLSALTESITKEYAVDAGRVYVAGLSAGAAMAVIMAQTYPDLYAAVGVHSGLAYQSASNMPSAMMAMRKGADAAITESNTSTNYVPMIVFHGDQDHTVSVRNGGQVFEQAKQRLQAQKSNLQTQQQQKSSEQGTRSTQIQICDDKGLSLLEYWKIHGASHSWAGGSHAGSYTDPNGPDASKEMMRFFLNHTNKSYFK
ncbi:extracellular catalytic domain type 1 short-chain-length polyhydroxyalkanoate depolymerase [Psychrobacter sp. T6-1]|uniref:extracellular catalytic domain type 1 short-chain-length polyhydroxyalkanoate depolymerase n=1 Tax=Psychrobacter sp. T6-1 TaxID=3457447 RepID=UPI003FCF41A8